jgi:hypothetical protein
MDQHVLAQQATGRFQRRADGPGGLEDMQPSE